MIMLVPKEQRWGWKVLRIHDGSVIGIIVRQIVGLLMDLRLLFSHLLPRLDLGTLSAFLNPHKLFGSGTKFLCKHTKNWQFFQISAR